MPRPAFGSLPKVPLAPRARVLLKSYLQDTSISANLFRSQWILCFRFVRYISLPPKRTSSIERTRISWPLFVHTSSNRSDGARASSFDRPKAFLRIGWSSISGNAMASILWYYDRVKLITLQDSLPVGVACFDCTFSAQWHLLCIPSEHDLYSSP